VAGDAGGREVGRISIRAVPSTGTFRQDLLAELRKIEADLPRITVGTDVDTTRLTAQVDEAVARAQRLARNVNIKTDVDSKPIDELGRKLDNLGAKARSAGNDLPNLHLGLVRIGTTALSAVPGVFSLAGSLEKVAGAFGLVPGLVEAAAAGVATLVVGLHGMKDVLDPKTTADPAKYAAALAALAPSARKAAVEMASFGAVLHTLQQNVQQSLFAGLSTQIDLLGSKLIPVLNAGMVGVARQANLAAVAFAQFSTSAASVRDLGGVFANITKGFHNLVPGGHSPVVGVAGHRDGVGAVPAAVGDGDLARGVRVRDVHRDRASDGQLADVDRSGHHRGQAVGFGRRERVEDVPGDRVGCAGRWWRDVAGSRVGDEVDRDDGDGPVFQTGLRQFFTGLQAGFAALSSAMPALGSALAALGPPLAALTQGIGTTLAQAIQALAPAIVQMAPALTQLVQSLAGLASATISTIAPVLLLIAKAAAFVVQNVPGATVALSGLALAFGAAKVAEMVGYAGALTKVGSAIKTLVVSSSAVKAIKVGFAAGDVATAGAFAGTLGKVGAAASKVAPAFAGMAAAAGPVGLAIGGVAATALIVNSHVNKMRDAIDNASEAAGRLKSSMDSGNTSLNTFVTNNQRAISELRKLDSANQKAYLVQIGFDLINEQGYTPAKAFAALQQLANAAGITLPISLKVGSLSDVNEQLRAIGTTAVEAANEINKDPFGAWSVGASHAQELIKGIATSANDALNSDNWSGAVSQIQAFQQALKNSNVPIDAQNTAMQRLSQAFLKQTGLLRPVDRQHDEPYDRVAAVGVGGVWRSAAVEGLRERCAGRGGSGW
jgi:hypothetical protein